jgi:hypothetical protein
VIACAPSLAPAFAIVFVVGVILTATVLRGRGLARVIWLVVPTIVVFAPLVWTRLSAGSPGRCWPTRAFRSPTPRAPMSRGDAARARLPGAVTGDVSSADGWGASPGRRRGLDAAPRRAGARARPRRTRARPLDPALVLAITALTGLGTAAAAIGVAVASDGPDAVTLFPALRSA